MVTLILFLITFGIGVSIENLEIPSFGCAQR
jgi:hypothetical protein